MSLHEVKTSFKGGMAFESSYENQTVRMDAGEDVGGQDSGFRPKPMLLAALSGCTGMDVVSLLHKMRVEFSEFDIKIDAELGEEHPKQYQKIHIIYQVKLNDEDQAKFEKAVNLSQERYCGVSAMLAKVAELSWEIKYL
ncbi:MAG: OsmC family protein [Bacteroidia bacterium]